MDVKLKENLRNFCILFSIFILMHLVSQQKYCNFRCPESKVVSPECDTVLNRYTFTDVSFFKK
jgi:hypothetical protein